MKRLTLVLTCCAGLIIVASQTRGADPQFPVNKGAPSPAALEAAKLQFIASYLSYETTGNRDVGRTLGQQYGQERLAVINALHAGKTVQAAANLVQHAAVVGAGKFSVPLGDQQVTWLFQDQCEITTESVSSNGGLLNVVLVGLGAQEVIGDPLIGEKRLDLAAMMVRPQDTITISSNSFSPFGKAVIVIGGLGLLSGGCAKPAAGPPPACSPTAGRCPNPSSCTAPQTCTPMRDVAGFLAGCTCR